MISNDVEFESYRQHLARHGRVQVPGFLQAAAAERIHQCLCEDVRWTLAERIDGKPKTTAADVYASMSEAQLQEIYRLAYARAGTEFQFLYDSYMLVRAQKEGRDPGMILHVVLDFLNSAEVLDFASWFIGVPDIVAANAQATRYLPGHFLTRHEDENKSENRAAAFVINLSRDWNPDWGGLLQFHDESGGICETLLPRWNSFSVFRVPQPHSVSLVAPWAGQPRLAITGWFLRAKA